MSGLTDSIQHTELHRGENAVSGLFSSAAQQRIWLVSLFTCSVLARLGFAQFLFLDADEAMHYWLSVQPSLGAAYRTTLTTAHPPLFLLFLYYWRGLGHSEIVLRLPGVLAGIAFCWVAYRWIARVANQEVADIALPMLLFTPSLIWLSAEVRQYSLLLLFLALALYCFERAVEERSVAWMTGSTLALDLALATHYSGLLFALALGIYALLRLAPLRESRLWTAWAVGQLSALLEVAFFFEKHIQPLKKSGLPQEIADTWLRKSIFHWNQDHVVPFFLRDTIRFFRYLLGNGVAGALGLAAFCLGVFFIFKRATRRGGSLSSASLRALVVLPFAVAVLAALAGIYPYGGTRHDVFLAPFAILGISIALSFWHVRRPWMRNAVILLVLALANVSPSPAGPFMKPRNQSKSLMSGALRVLRTSPQGSVISTDYEGGLLLSYYLCNQPAVQLVPPYQPFFRSSCGHLILISEEHTQWSFDPSDFGRKVDEIAKIYGLPQGSDLLVFRAGWPVSNNLDLLHAFESFGCNRPAHFGKNVLICHIKVGGNSDVGN